MADSANVIKKSEPGCECAGLGMAIEKLCPEGLRLYKAQLRALLRVDPNVPATREDYQRAREAYRAHVEG